MATFLLIHGSCHGAWCWKNVLPLLNTQGHRAFAIDLPAHGDDTTPADQVTLDSYADAILAAIDEPVILVGHSMAGFPISAAAEKAPEKIAKLVYLCAYTPISGKSLVDMRRDGPRQLLMDAIIASDDGVTFSFDPAKAEEKFYHDCSEVLDYAVPRLCPQPIKPQATPITLTERYNSVAKHYIRCADDRAIPPEYQPMTGDWPEGTLDTLDCSHSPFFAMPEQLAQTLLRIAEDT